MFILTTHRARLVAAESCSVNQGQSTSATVPLFICAHLAAGCCLRLCLEWEAFCAWRGV